MENLPPLSIETIWAILNEQIADQTVKELVWYHLGYRYDSTQEIWDTRLVSDDWKIDYPTPPNFIEERPPVVKLTRSIPTEHKQGLKERLGFKGYTIGTFNPRMTRRATMANWLLSQIPS